MPNYVQEKKLSLIYDPVVFNSVYVIHFVIDQRKYSPMTQILTIDCSNKIFHPFFAFLTDRPFAPPGHMVQNYINWWASSAVGLPKQRQVHCFGSPIGNFVPCDQVVQRANSMVWFFLFKTILVSIYDGKPFTLERIFCALSNKILQATLLLILVEILAWECGGLIINESNCWHCNNRGFWTVAWLCAKL